MVFRCDRAMETNGDTNESGSNSQSAQHQKKAPKDRKSSHRTPQAPHVVVEVHSPSECSVPTFPTHQTHPKFSKNNKNPNQPTNQLELLPVISTARDWGLFHSQLVLLTQKMVLLFAHA